ncbi:MAG: hypothetical protein ABJD11_10655 [Gemmatimonadota bacterium]
MSGERTAVSGEREVGERKGGARWVSPRLLLTVCVSLVTLLLPAPLHAQGPIWFHLSAQAIPSYTHASAIPNGGGLGEVRIVQPILMIDAGALAGHLRFRSTLDAEGWTIPDGQLAPGDWGEGFDDRRHPHTYVHELILTSIGHSGPLGFSLSVGKGFVPFGTDDPMSRPALIYPVNHHLSQILERGVAALGLSAGPVVLEGSLFDGDEPERPGQWPLLGTSSSGIYSGWRFGDSWSARLTVRPGAGLEFQGSRARVRSPEHRPGAGTDNFKWSVSGRLAREIAGAPGYALIEWARSTEASGFFVFHSFLLEGAWSPGRHRPYYRFERTDRPEDMRTLDPFRSVRPHLENSILGTTRWTVHTIGYGLLLSPSRARWEIQPFAEASYSKPENLSGGIFDPATFYRSDHIWTLSAGLRLSWLMSGHRMGRYGVAADEGGSMGMGMVMPPSHGH